MCIRDSYKIYVILLHRCNLKIFTKNRFEKTAIFVKLQQKIANHVAKFAKFCQISKFQLENLVDFEKCCKTRIHLQRSAPIQPKTSETFPKIAKNWQVPFGPVPLAAARGPRRCSGSRPAARTSFGSAGTTSRPGKLIGGCKIGKICEFFADSFSAVSKWNFARKYVFDRIFQALQYFHTFAPLQSQNFSKKSVWQISNFRENSAKFCKCRKICKMLPNFKNLRSRPVNRG